MSIGERVLVLRAQSAPTGQPLECYGDTLDEDLTRDPPARFLRTHWPVKVGSEVVTVEVSYGWHPQWDGVDPRPLGTWRAMP